MLENSSSSSTMPDSRSLSRMMMPMPREQVSGSMPGSCMVSAQPLIAVSGVRSSWEIEEIKSFFIFSDFPSSTAISLILSHSCPISSSLVFNIRTPKSPCAIRLEMALICLIGVMMELMKYRPDATTSTITSAPAHSRNPMTRTTWWSACSNDTT